MATLFVSHASRNDKLASELEHWLRTNGFTDLFVDHSDIRGGDKWSEALRAAKSSCRVVLCLLTPEWLSSDECFGEFTAAWYQGKRVVPLLALKDDVLDDTQQRRRSRVLAEDQGFDISLAISSDGLSLEDYPGICEPLKAGLRAGGALEKIGLDPYAFEVDRGIRPDPFPGLDCFQDTDADAAVFFGRAPEIARCLEDLREMRANGDQKPYAIQGASGSGKSSLMKAGILPRLRRERGWLVLRSFRPGSDPLLNFADAIARTGKGYGLSLSAGTVRDKLLEAWRAVSRGDGGENGPMAFAGRSDMPALRSILDELLDPLRAKADRNDATILIAMDQGEEIARCEGESADALCDYFRAAMLALGNLSGQTETTSPRGFRLMFTVRLDSLQELNRAARMHSLEARGAEIRSVPIYRYAHVIEGPAARYGVEIEDGLVEALMDDSPGEEALPMLAFAVHRLWIQYAQDKRIRRRNYETSGKFSGLIEDAAERALAGQAPAEEAPRRKISAERDRLGAQTFVYALAQVNENGSPLRRVADWSGLSSAQREMLEGFDKWRLVVRKPSAANALPSVEPAHEALFREWPRFLSRLEPEKARLSALRGVEGATQEWLRNKRRSVDLAHRGRRLKEAQDLLTHPHFSSRLDHHARAYLRSSGRAEFIRRFSRSMLIVIGTAIVTVLAMKFLDSLTSVVG